MILASSYHELKQLLVGGLEHFLFSTIYGIIPPIHFHIFQDGYCTTNQYTQFDQKWVVHTIPNGRLMV